MRRYKRWTPEQDRVLRELYGHMPMTKIAHRLGAPVQSVYRRAHYIGLSGGYEPGRNRPPREGYFGPRVSIQSDRLPAGIVSVTRHRIIG